MGREAGTVREMTSLCQWENVRTWIRNHQTLKLFIIVRERDRQTDRRRGTQREEEEEEEEREKKIR